ncbi:MAG: hypothetical protein JJE46_09465 [Acidimicrobiia bacterium]|nr:hypothetical protein [Acidimicrobiia bacterium]
MENGQSTPARVNPAASAPGTQGAPGAKPPLFRHPGRVAIVGAGLFLVAALIAGAIGSADTSDLSAAQTKPKEVQLVSPAAGSIVGPNTPIVVDLRDDLVGDLTVCGPNPQDCTPIPFDQVRFVSGLGEMTFKPADGTDLSAFNAGLVTVRVDYRAQGTTATDAGSYSWSFQAKA